MAGRSIWSAENVLNIIPLVYGIPTFVLYFIVLFVLLYRFRTPFYLLFTINGISETVWWWTGMIKYRAASAPILFPLFEAFPVTGPLVSILFFFNYALLITSRASNFLMTLNRFTVMHLSARLYEKLWKFLLPVAVVAMCVVAAWLNIAILTAGASLKPPLGDRSTYYFEPHDGGVEYRQSLYSIAVIIAFAPAMLFMNLSIAYSLWKRGRDRGKSGNSAIDAGIRDAEAKLCVITFTIMLTNAVGLVCQMFFFVAGGGENMDPKLIQTLSTIQGFAEDVHILAEPWMLVGMSRVVRSQVVRLLCCKRFFDLQSSQTLFLQASRRSVGPRIGVGTV